MDWALYQSESQELAGKIDLENYAQMADFDFSSFSLIHLELKGNSLSQFPCQTQFKIVVVQICGCFWTKIFFKTPHPFKRHISL